MMQNTRTPCRCALTQAQLMRKIQETDFALQEVTLFLNTHPHCKKALKYFHEIRNESLALTGEYEKRFGPVTAAGNNCENGWRWADTPWPWQSGNGGCRRMERGNY